ncbi:MAG: sigma 54-interacting transcriptional regulator, partial [Magnetospirillum sp.]|nr:sigma 54-interacting transcriptional regulator [Magnetospirillum sp.]
VIPNSLMRHVLTSGMPILLDIMAFGERSFVVTRVPLKDEAGQVIGAVGFVLYDRPEYLKPLVSKFTTLQEELNRAKRELAGARRAKYTFSQFLGTSEPVREVKRLARSAAQMDSTVLLLGETGTGKELLAHAIHAASVRADKPMVTINVAAVPDTLLEAEFFGAAPGAYTGADRKGRDGKFKLADGGTLFLDEIGDMPLALQSKLLRVLQEREIEPLGSNKIIQVDVRIIAATSRDLAALVRANQFRADLYYRLNVVPITLPPLRQRVEDIESIAEAILERLCMRTGTGQRELDHSAVAALSAYDWPGNVRELCNILERVVAMTDAPVLTSGHLRAILPLTADPGEAGTDESSLNAAMSQAERKAIIAALSRAGGVKAQAARLLGISRASLYERIAALGIG